MGVLGLTYRLYRNIKREGGYGKLSDVSRFLKGRGGIWETV